jgi:hypothetical protein
MADLNALIAQGVQFQRPPDPFAQYGQMQQLQQGQQQNQLNQMKMQQMQQASQRQNALYGTLAGFKPDMPVDAQVAELVRGGHLTEARSLAESHAKAQKDLRDADAAQLTNFATKTKLAGQILAGVKDDASYQRALPKLAAIDPKAAAAMPPTFDPAFVANEVQAGLDLKEQLERHFQEQNLGGSVRTVAMPKYGTGPAAVVQGSEAAVTPLPADVEAQKARIALAGRPPAQPRPEQPPVAVVDQATGKIVYVSREEALANRMTPATSIEGIAPKEIQKREAAYPQVTAAFKGAIAENEQLASDLEKLKVHPGLSGMTGTIYGRTLSMKGPSKEAKALYDKIVARGGFQKLTDMRQSSPTGAALGPVSDSEGKYLRAAFGALDPNQNTDSFQKAIDQAITELRSSNGRLQDAYGMTYDYRGEQSAPAPKPGGSALSPAEQSELDALRIRFKK